MNEEHPLIDQALGGEAAAYAAGWWNRELNRLRAENARLITLNEELSRHCHDLQQQLAALSHN